MRLRTGLRERIDGLLADLRRDDGVTLDQVGNAIGTLAVSTDEIDAVLSYIEATGRRISSPMSTAGADLRVVLPAIRAVRARTGRSPTVDELAAETGMTPAAVRTALMLAQIMGR